MDKQELAQKSRVVTTCHCGANMLPAGIGAYPYDCAAKDKHPLHMVYIGCEVGHTCWSHADVGFTDYDDVYGIFERKPGAGRLA